MDKNTIAAIVLSTIVIIVGFTAQSIFFPSQPVVENAVEAPVNQALPPQAGNDAGPALMSSSGETSPSSVPALEENEVIAEEFPVIETDLVRVQFTNRGGDVLSYKLKNHNDGADMVEMAAGVTDADRAFSILIGGSKGAAVNQLFHVKRISDTEIGFYRTIALKNSDGSESRFTLAKQYSFKNDDYMFELKVVIDGDSSFGGLSIGDAAYTLRTSPQIGPSWDPKQDKYEYRKFYHLLNGKKKTVALGTGQSKALADKVSWTGVAGKYFTLIAVPGVPTQGFEYSTAALPDGSSCAQIYVTRSAIASGRQTDTWKFYVGPRTDKALAPYNLAGNNPWNLSDLKLNDIVDTSGILGPLEVFLKWIMELFYMLIPNWGVSIILMTILMRIVIFPLTKKSSESTLKMQELQPKIQEIQAKYKDNQAKMNEEMAKFYQTAGYNPLSGCLPLLIQFPLIFAMYNLFNNYFEFRGAMFIPGWIPDLSQGDSVMALPFTLPLLEWSDLRILPIVYVVSQLLFGKVTQTPATAQQNSSMKIMLYGMPLFFFFLFYNAPAGLLLYWTLSNVLTLVQQVIINRMMHAKKSGAGLKLVK